MPRRLHGTAASIDYPTHPCINDQISPLPLNNRPSGHVDFKAMLRDDSVCPHQMIRDYCPAIIELRRRRSDEVYTTSRIGGCSYRRLRSYSEAFSRIPTLRCLGDEYELTGAIIGRRLRPICAMGGDAMQIGWPRILLVWQLTAGWLTANATHSRSITAARPAPNLSSPLPMCYTIWQPRAPVVYIPEYYRHAGM